MANPTRFTSGISTFLPKSALNTWPSVITPQQVTVLNEFIPYRAGDWTVTQTNGTVTTLPWANGGVTMATTGTTAADKIVAGLVNGNAFQIVNGNQTWANINIAFPIGSIDVNAYAGFSNNVDITAATDGIYFLKPAGGTLVNLVIKKATVTTTITGVADLAKPSGIAGDTSSVAGTLTATQSGGLYNSIAVGTPGSGYAIAPYVAATGATGTGASGNVTLGAAGSINGAYVTAPGASYTTALFTVTPWINLSIYWDGKDGLTIGVNGKKVVGISSNGATAIAAGATVAASTGPSFTSSTQISTLLAPVQPKAGSAFNILPLVPLTASIGFTNTTANARSMIVDAVNVANELN